jgi:hypothetical protein
MKPPEPPKDLTRTFWLEWAHNPGAPILWQVLLVRGDTALITMVGCDRADLVTQDVPVSALRDQYSRFQYFKDRNGLLWANPGVLVKDPVSSQLVVYEVLAVNTRSVRMVTYFSSIMSREVGDEREVMWRSLQNFAYLSRWEIDEEIEKWEDAHPEPDPEPKAVPELPAPEPPPRSSWERLNADTP